MKVLILTSVVSDGFAYSPGDKLDLTDAEANRLINGGFALRLVETSTDDFTTTIEAANYTLMAAPSGTIPPSGGYYWDASERLHIVHPSGGKAIIDPLHLLPGWSP